MKQAIITAIVMTIIIILAVQYEKYELKQATTCTPSEEHSQLLEQLSGVNERLDEMYQCDKYEEDKDEINDTTYCNSVGCRGSEQAYKDWSKMDNNNPQKWIYTSEQEKKNYFDWSKLH